MKKFAYFIFALAFAACTSNVSNTYQQEAEKLSELLKNYMDNYDDSSDIKAEYDEERQCIELSWKCKTLTASYDLHFKDLLTDNPTSYADGFRISMVLFYKGITKIGMLEFDYEGTKYKMLPLTSETIDDRGVVMAGFLPSNDANAECLYMLSNLSGLVTGKIHTNKGPIDIPLEDVFNLRGMARNYVIDGGKFESEKKN